MKKCLIAMAVFGVLIGAAFSFHRPRTAMLSAEETATRSTPERSLEEPLPTNEVAATPEGSRPSPTAANGREQTPPAPSTPRDAGLVFNEAIETLVSPQASFDQKQVAWKQLKERGQLDMAISELEERTANDPRRAENVAALGQAYLKKCGVIQDVREQAILAMKADQTLESALSLDPSNWADGTIYVPNKSGDIFVLRASPKFEILATNSVGEPTNASLAASNNELFLRTDKALWCLANPK